MIIHSNINWQDSVVDEVTFCGRRYFVKRDDLLRPFPGNKARKLEGLLQRDWRQIERVISHGGAQSNAMLALARLAAHKHTPFDYYTRKLPGWLKQSPVGNLRRALDLGMRLIESDDGLRPTNLPANVLPANVLPANVLPANVLMVPQGISMPEAEIGLKRLAREITGFAEQRGMESLAVVVPSGTGATAVYLQKHLKFPVLTTPCVGNPDYLLEQFSRLQSDKSKYPLLLRAPDRFTFGKTDKRLLHIWRALKAETGIEFDLLYDPVTWLAVQNWQVESPVMYIHCGGVEGNASMLRRYERNDH